jgi:hypothetical protein
MSPLVLTLFDAGTLVLAAIGLVRLWPVVRQTTLTTVWPWAWVAWAAAVLSWSLRFGSETLVTYADYFTAVAVLSPPLASLGARRPTCRSWLLWPAGSIALATRFNRPLVLDTPAIVMYVVVLVMALGNYAFGRLGPLVMVFALLLAAQVSQLGPRWTGLSAEFFRLITLWVAIFLIFGFREILRPTAHVAFEDPELPESHRDPFDAILFEFGELYGLVWSLRLQDRLNVFAAQHHWPGKFEGRRGHWTTPLTESQRAEVEHAFRWLFRRFVDSTWIDTRLHTPGTAVADSYRSSIDS